ncbi:MAG TPA: hypothetical protein VEA41_01865 [Salinarimonas sp.]|nr:hypothetical protein [Salinarimonas sp.]
MDLTARIQRLEETAGATEDALTGLSRSVGDLAKAVEGLTVALKGPDHRPEEGVIWQVRHLDQRRRVLDKVLVALLTAFAIAAGGFLFRMSWIVQAAKLP